MKTDIEGRLIEVVTAVLLQEAPQRVDDPFLMDITAPKRALSLQIPVDRPVKCALLRDRAHAAPSTMLVTGAGRGSATSRRVPVCSRR